MWIVGGLVLLGLVKWLAFDKGDTVFRNQTRQPCTSYPGERKQLRDFNQPHMLPELACSRFLLALPFAFCLLGLSFCLACVGELFQISLFFGFRHFLARHWVVKSELVRLANRPQAKPTSLAFASSGTSLSGPFLGRGDVRSSIALRAWHADICESTIIWSSVNKDE